LLIKRAEVRKQKLRTWKKDSLTVAHVAVWSPPELGIRFVPPNSYDTWINTGCSSGTVEDPNPRQRGCKFIELWEDAPSHPPEPWYLMGVYSEPNQNPLAGVLITSLAISLFGAVVGISGLVIEGLEFRGCLPHHCAHPKCLCSPHKYAHLYFMLDTVITLLDFAFIAAVFIIAFGEPTTS
jgi:hypothetical protein